LTTNRPNHLGGSGSTARTIDAGLRRPCRLSEAGVAVSRSARSRPGIYETGSGLFTKAAVSWPSAYRTDTAAAALAAGTEAAVSRGTGTGRCEQ
jgi:hypothetical protein